MRQDIKLFRIVREANGRLGLYLAKVSRKRFIGIAMYYGIPARVAREMARLAQERGADYRRATIALLNSIVASTAEEEDELYQN